jgi:hypothetical protein
MVYLGGDNNLAEEMVYALKCMEMVGSNPPEFEVFALYDGGVSPVPFAIGKRRQGPSDLLKRAERSRNAETDARIEEQETVLKGLEKHHEAVKQDVKGLKHGSRRHESWNKKAVIGPSHGSASLTPPTSPDTIETIVSDAKEAVDDAKKILELLKTGAHQPDTADPVQSVLAEFVIGTIQEHPAEKYMLILSGHGSGAVGDFLTSNSRFSGLSIPDLKDALSDVQSFFADKMFHASDGTTQAFLENGTINILGMDSCLMGMAEVAFEVRGYVDFLIGTEGFEPNTGWPYDEILTLLKGNPTAKNLAKEIVDKYIAYYSSDYTLAEVSTDQTALDLTSKGRSKSKLDRFAEALGGLDGLSGLLINGLSNTNTAMATRNAVVMAHWRAQGYKNEQHVDVFDFCQLLQEHYDRDHPIWIACQKVKKTIEGKDALVLRSSYCGPAFQHSHGVSIFFPWANITDAVGVSEVDHYRGLDFAVLTFWDEFLKTYHLKTQRELRDTSGRVHDSMLNRREGIFTGPPPEDDKAVGPNSGFKAVGPNSVFKSVGPNSGFKAVGPNSGFKAVGPNSGFKAVGPNSGFKAVGPNSGFKAVGPNSGFKAVGPNSGFKMSGGLVVDSLPKIASMKNPPVKWKDLD